MKYPIAMNQYESHSSGRRTVKYERRFSAEYISVGSSLLPSPMRAHAILHSANNAAEMDTPLDLHFFRIALVRSSENESVGTTVRRSASLRRGKVCPPTSFCCDIWKSILAAALRSLLHGKGIRSSRALGRIDAYRMNHR